MKKIYFSIFIIFIIFFLAACTEEEQKSNKEITIENNNHETKENNEGNEKTEKETIHTSLGQFSGLVDENFVEISKEDTTTEVFSTKRSSLTELEQFDNGDKIKFTYIKNGNENSILLTIELIEKNENNEKIINEVEEKNNEEEKKEEVKKSKTEGILIGKVDSNSVEIIINETPNSFYFPTELSNKIDELGFNVPIHISYEINKNQQYILLDIE